MELGELERAVLKEAMRDKASVFEVLNRPEYRGKLDLWEREQDERLEADCRARSEYLARERDWKDAARRERAEAAERKRRAKKRNADRRLEAKERNADRRLEFWEDWSIVLHRRRISSLMSYESECQSRLLTQANSYSSRMVDKAFMLRELHEEARATYG